MRTPSRQNNAGFTLAELLVASLLISLTMTGVYVMFVSTIATWNANEKRFDRFLEARALLDSFERDLGNMLPAAGHLFEGKKDEITMFVVEQPMAIPKSDGTHLLRVNYNHDRSSKQVVREEALVTTALPQAPPQDKPLDRGRIKVTVWYQPYRPPGGSFVWQRGFLAKSAGFGTLSQRPLAERVEANGREAPSFRSSCSSAPRRTTLHQP